MPGRKQQRPFGSGGTAFDQGNKALNGLPAHFISGQSNRADLGKHNPCQQIIMQRDNGNIFRDSLTQRMKPRNRSCSG